jgi:aerobic-type carbon monoxide dehydrogenase small subunit (CoxS/CutS family)
VTAPEAPSVEIELDGRLVELPAAGTLLDALRGELGLSSLKDGCSPQGQCGCCTVLIDGVARVACVSPMRRMAGKRVTTLDGLDPVLLDRLTTAFESFAASQCGFCTPGILTRLVGLARKGVPSEAQVRSALGAHLCRCTGLQPIVDAALAALDPSIELGRARDPAAAAARATLESGTAQAAGPDVVLGRSAFAADTAAAGSLLAIATQDGGYALGESLAEARDASAKVQGRNSTAPLRHPLEPPVVEGAVLELATTFVEPAYAEPDASSCAPGGEPSSPFANAGAFGAKRGSAVREDARRLADQEGRAVLALWPREEVVRRGKKRPPLALALRADGSGAVRIARTPGSDELDALAAAVAERFSSIEVELVDVLGPALGASHRGAVVAELLCALAVLEQPTGPIEVRAPSGARARVEIGEDGRVAVGVAAGDPLCEATLASYVTGAVHHGLGMVRSEGISVDEDGVVHDLTIRSFGLLSASATPRIDVTLEDDAREPLAAGVAVLAATMAAAWREAGLPPRWPLSGGRT